MNKIILTLIIISAVFMLILILRDFAATRRKRELPPDYAEVIVVANRSKTRDFGGDRDYTRSFMTNCFITFQFISDDFRQELRIPEKDFSLIAEGDEGTLWHREGLFHSFDRK